GEGGRGGATAGVDIDGRVAGAQGGGQDQDGQAGDGVAEHGGPSEGRAGWGGRRTVDGSRGGDRPPAELNFLRAGRGIRIILDFPATRPHSRIRTRLMSVPSTKPLDAGQPEPKPGRPAAYLQRHPV